ncbi:MAG: nucleotide exchange factor GrpE [Treponema sp.]|nr:nucleotide exchange factor GrpE [Treponema sp.]
MIEQETQTGQPDQEQAQVEGNEKEEVAAQGATQSAAEGADSASETSPSPVTPEEKIADLEEKLAESHNQFLRKAAEFENFRKRMNQEKTSAIEYANQSLLLDIIPIIDDFERAIQAGEAGLQAGSADYNGFLEGIKMIEKRFINQLEVKWGLKRFNSAGELFDPNLHEALFMEKSSDVTEATVQEDLVKGYYLKERVIRAAKVKVLMPETN